MNGSNFVISLLAYSQQTTNAEKNSFERRVFFIAVCAGGKGQNMKLAKLLLTAGLVLPSSGISTENKYRMVKYSKPKLVYNMEENSDESYRSAVADRITEIFGESNEVSVDGNMVTISIYDDELCEALENESVLESKSRTERAIGLFLMAKGMRSPSVSIHIVPKNN